MYELQLNYSNMENITTGYSTRHVFRDLYFKKEFILWVHETNMYIIYKLFYNESIKQYENIYSSNPFIGQVSSYTTRLVEFSTFSFKPMLLEFNNEEDRNLFKLTWC